jgi:cytochrome b561
MSDVSDRSRYSPAQRRLHWGMFLLLLVAYLVIELHDDAPRGSALRLGLMQTHILAGLAVLVLIGPRLWQRYRRGVPPVTPAVPGWQASLSSITHLALYAFLLIQPILGALSIWAGGRGIPIYLTGIEIPSPFAGNHDLHEYIEGIHGELGNIFYWVIGLHVAAGLFHHFVRRDDTLRRML